MMAAPMSLRRLMSNRDTSRLLLAVLVLLLAGCSRTASQEHGFLIEESDPDHVYVVHGPTRRVVIDVQVLDYEFESNHLHVLQLPGTTIECPSIYGNKHGALVTSYSQEQQYWLIGLQDAKVYGPMSRPQYESQAASRGVNPSSLSISRRDRRLLLRGPV